jgi:NADH:ubiquinone oxidoreductase subunit 3 (subunit A)
MLAMLSLESEVCQLTVCLFLWVGIAVLDVFEETRKVDEKYSAFECCCKAEDAFRQFVAQYFFGA